MNRKNFGRWDRRRDSVAGSVVLAVVLALSSICFAQEDVVAIDTNLVTVPVTISDRDGRRKDLLEKADFRIYENGVEQEVSYFDVADQPVTILFLIDVSSSMLPHRQNLDTAVAALVSRLNPADRVGITSFFLFSKKLLKPTTVSELHGPVGYKFYKGADCPNTYLYNAVDEALDQLKKAPGRKAIVLFTDGIGGGYGISAEDVFEKAEESDSIIYTFKFGIQPETSEWVSPKVYEKRLDRLNDFLDGITSRTGGRKFQFEQISDVDAAIDEVAAELRRNYVLGYYPDQQGNPGERRSIKVEVSNPNVAVRSRPFVVFEKRK